MVFILKTAGSVEFKFHKAMYDFKEWTSYIITIKILENRGKKNE